MRRSREVLLLPAVSFAAGIYASSFIQFDLPVLLAGLVALCSLWWLSRASTIRPVACSACFLVAGATANEYHRPGPPPELDAEPGEELLISGCIVEPVVSADGIQRLVIELQPGARVRMTLGGSGLPALRYGQRVELKARVRKPRNFQNPGAFDYRGWLARQQIFWVASARAPSAVRVLGDDCGSVLQRTAMRIREAVVRRVRKLYPAGSYEANLLPALLVGDNGVGDRDWSEEYRRTGTYHALVVSGLHIAVVAGSLLLLLRLTGLPLGLILSLAAAVAWFYAAVVNWQPPAVRSAAGFTLYLAAKWSFRRGRVLNLLAAVVLVILALDPGALFDASLQLTVLSVAAIGGLASPAAERWLTPYSRALRRLGDGRQDHLHPSLAAQFRIECRLLAETVALISRTPLVFWARLTSGAGRIVFWIMESALLSACVQLALAVPLAFYFHTFSATAIGANVIVAPALSLAVPAGLLACLIPLPLFTALTSGLLAFARTATALFARLEPGIRIPDPPVPVAAISLLATGILGAGLIGRRRWWPAAGMLAIGSTLLIWMAPFPPDLNAAELELSVIDVGQGDSLFVAAPDGRTLLIDAGGIPNYGGRPRRGLDPGEDVVSPYLWRRGLSRLDVVAVSHLHEDHAGGLPAVIRNFRPREVWTGAAPPGPALRSIEAAASVAGSRLRRLSSGFRWGAGKFAVAALAPAPEYQPGPTPQNRDSLVLLLRFGARSFLLTGDTDSQTESWLTVDDIDVLKVAHHGSRGSTTSLFLERARPLFAAISAGEANTYGHPHPELVDRLRQAGVRTFRTDRHGLVTFRTDGRRIELEY